MRQVVSALVPAYNEEKRIRSVLTTLLGCKRIDEVICINDGSTDSTTRILKEISGLKVITLEKNCGKAYAITRGILEAKGDIALFIDADLAGLKEEYINALLDPLEEENFDASVGYRSGALDKYVFMPLSGERAYFKKDILPFIEEIKNKGYGLELHLNYAFKDKRVKLLALKGVRHADKYKKQSYTVAAKGMMVEVGDLLYEVFSQKNPISFFIDAYIYPFYARKSSKRIQIPHPK